MSGDARFQDGAPAAPLRLVARGMGDLAVISALVQDAVLTPDRLTYAVRRRRFALILNRFRWEDAEAARAEGRGFERVQSLLVIEGVLAVQSQGLDRAAPPPALNLLALSFAPRDDEGLSGQLRLHLAGEAALRLDVEALDVTLSDIAKPYAAPSGRAPGHET